MKDSEMIQRDNEQFSVVRKCEELSQKGEPLFGVHLAATFDDDEKPVVVASGAEPCTKVMHTDDRRIAEAMSRIANMAFRAGSWAERMSSQTENNTGLPDEVVDTIVQRVQSDLSTKGGLG